MLKTFSALAEPNRFQIVQYLQGGPHSVGEIVTKLSLNQPQVSKHLHFLLEAGLVEVQVAAQHRIYRLRPQPFQEMEEWLASFRKVWEARFDRLDEYLSELQQNDKE